MGETVGGGARGPRPPDETLASELLFDRGEGERALLETRTRAVGVQEAPQPAWPGGLLETRVSGTSEPSGGLEAVVARDRQHERIGRYVVLRKLGEGGMGAVYSAYDEELDRRVAIKVVREHLAGDTLGHARMQREAQAMAKLSHPNVVQVYDVGLHHGEVFVAMEFVRGRTLREWQEGLNGEDPAARRALIDVYVQAGRGLAAAHTVGLVHRDFKPDNVLVGDDGRVRVLDFGLASASGEAGRGSVGASPGASAAPLTSDLTRTGSVMGTPAYMAPEQFMAQRGDARTDQFSFCVALYAALYGHSPYSGDTFAERRAAVCGGVVAPAPPGSKVPGRLRELLLRGLARRPEDRHASMDALLADLLADPEDQRRRRVRIAVITAVVTVLAGLLTYAAALGWRAWERQRAESAAIKRLAQVESSYAELSAQGDEAGAERLFQWFVRDPAHRGTAALALAWLARAEREAAAASGAALDSYAASYAVATTAEHQVAALAGLVRFFVAQHRWQAVTQAVTTLERLDPGALMAADLAAARVQSTFLVRDLEGAIQALEGAPAARRERLQRLSRALMRAHRTALRSAPPPRSRYGAGPELGIFRPSGLERVALSPGLPSIAELASPWHFYGAIAPGRDGQARYLAIDKAAGEGVLLRAGSAGQAELEELLRWPEQSITSALVEDLDGDGRAEIYVGTGPYTRRILKLSEETDGNWSMSLASAAVDRRISDVNTLDAGDLDGDGAPEVIAGLGPWRAYEVQVLRYSPASGELETAARLKMGAVYCALIRGRAGLEIAAWKTDRYLSAGVFPPDRPSGSPAGLYVLGLVGDGLEQRSWSPLPAGEAIDGYYSEEMWAGDLDGDGVDEVLVAYRDTARLTGEQRPSAAIYSRTEAGGFEILPLGGIDPLVLADVDGDGDAEIIAVNEHNEVWVLGSGAQPLGRMAAATGGQSEAPIGASRELARSWAQVNDLAAMGLDLQAAAAFERLAEDLAGQPELAARAWMEAARIHEGRGDDGAAAGLFARAAASPALMEEAAAAALKALEIRGEEAAALAITEDLLRAEPAAEIAATLRRAQARLRTALDPARRAELRWDAPMDGRWRILAPLALRRDALAGALVIEGVGTQTLAELPMTWTGERLMMEVDIELDRIEWGQVLRAEIDTGAGAPTLQIEAMSRGGSGEQRYELRCVSGGQDLLHRIDVDLARPRGPGRLVVRAVVSLERGEMMCLIREGEGEGAVVFDRRRKINVDASTAAAPAEQRVTLRIAAATLTEAASLASASLRRISTAGAVIAAQGWGAGDEPDTDEQAIRIDIVEGRTISAIAGLSRLAEARAGSLRAELEVWGFALLGRAGRWQEAAELLTELLADPSRRGEVRAALLPLMRTAPELTSSALRAAVGALAQQWMMGAWQNALQMRRRDPLAIAVIGALLEDFDAGTADAESAVEALRMRAIVSAERGALAEARADLRAAREAMTRARPAAVESAEATAWARREGSLALEEATIAAKQGDRRGARSIVQELLAGGADELYVQDVLAARPEMKGLLDLP